ncbi:Uncharacterized protein SCG7086_BK_00010 [Chlamydiales bacterium SCGC AG-110-P3]|nr:Uncharacterized protein SCG7086_BK_00010 [Chlamydiales bacterium SCGC AG-110-P3]
MIERKIKTLLIQSVAKYPVTVITGPINSEKSKLVRETFDYTYITLSDLHSRTLAVNDPVAFMHQHYYLTGSLIIDDIHLAPELVSHLNKAVLERPLPGSFILLSARNHLAGLIAEHTQHHTLLPPSLSEIDNLEQSVEEAIFFGSYRNAEGALPDRSWHTAYLQRFFERELPRQLRLTRPESFITFTQQCAGAIGEVVNHSRLGDNCGVSHNTARLWLKLLVDNYLVFLLEPHQEGYGKRMVKTPKLYFYDTGLACALLGVQTPTELISHYHRGPLFESLIISDLIKERHNEAQDVEHSFWRDKLGNEVDLLVDESCENGRLLRPVEIKPGKTISASNFDGLIRWNKLSGSDASKGTIIYAGDDEFDHPMGNIISWRHRTGIVAAG